MDSFRLLRAFRGANEGEVFIKSGLEEDTDVYESEEGNELSESVVNTLIEVGGYIEEIASREFTPTMGQNVFFITGSGEIKNKAWTNSDWCNAQKDFLGVFATQELAEERLAEIADLLSLEQ